MVTPSSQTTYAHITKNPKVCSGNACIDGTRIRVMDVVVLLRAGYRPEQMHDEFLVPLTLAQVHAALAYYYDHQDEIQTAFAEEDRLEEELDRQHAAYSKRQPDG